jgi:two-component system LytT family response regulator
MPAEIIRLEGEGNYTQFYLTGERKYLSAKTMKEYEEILVQHNFLRIHKSHLINRSYIESYRNEGTVLLKNNISIPVSRQRRQTVSLLLKGK